MIDPYRRPTDVGCEKQRLEQKVHKALAVNEEERALPLHPVGYKSMYKMYAERGNVYMLRFRLMLRVHRAPTHSFVRIKIYATSHF